MTTDHEDARPLVLPPSRQLQQQHQRVSSTGSAGIVDAEYGSIAVTVIENEEHEPVLVHDFAGPVLLESDTVEHHDQVVGSIKSAFQHPVDAEQYYIPDSADHIEGEATVASTVASMTKNLVGCGALSLSNGLALCANSPAAMLAGNLWLVLLAAMMGYFCHVIAQVCQMTNRHTYRAIWQETVGLTGSVAVSLANTLKAGMANLAYATILSDTLRSLLAGLVGWDVSRVTCLLVITVTAILPLCLLKNLHVLAPFSALGTAGIGLTAVIMAIRYFDGSYSESGRFYNDLDPHLQPHFGTDNRAWTVSILPFVCMSYEAYVMHYNSARFYTELKDRSLSRFRTAVSSSFGIAALLYCAIASLGFGTFGGHSSGYILNNYSPYDPLATICRIAIFVAILFSYVIVFIGVRDGVMDMLEVPLVEQTTEKVNVLTLILLSILTLIAIFVTDLGLINALGGGLVATAIVFVFPTIMYRSAVKQQSGVIGDDQNKRLQVKLATVLTAIGVFLGLIGACLAVSGGRKA